MLIRLCWALALFGATCMAQNAIQVAYAEAEKVRLKAIEDAKTTPPPKTGNPNIDYKWDPNLPIELEGYDLSNYPFYNGLPDDLLDPTIYNFTCDHRKDGFYASVHHQCQVYHNCLFGQRYDFVCANYTVFSQKDFICHYVSLVDCKNSADHFDRNDELYPEPTTTPEPPPPRKFPKRPSPDDNPNEPVQPRPGRPRPRRPFFPKNRRQPAPRRTTPPPVEYDYYDYEYPLYDEYGYEYDPYYYDQPINRPSTTSTTIPPPPPTRRQRPRVQGRRPGANRIRPNAPLRATRVQDDARPLEQDIERNQPEVRRPANGRRPGSRPNKPVLRNTTPADPFNDYYDYDNKVSDEPPIPTTTAAPVLTTRRPTRIRNSPRRPQPATEDALLNNDQETENNNLPSTDTEERRPVNGRRPFRPAPEEPSSVPRRSGSGSVVNARRPFRPTAQESSPQEEAPARESLGSGRRGPSFPSKRRNSIATQPDEVVNEKSIIEEEPPLAPDVDLTADDTIPEDNPVEEASRPRIRGAGSRFRLRGRQQPRPQRQSPAAYYYYDYDYNY